MLQMARIANRHPHIVLCLGQGSTPFTDAVAQSSPALDMIANTGTDHEQPLPLVATVLSLEFASGGDLLAGVRRAGKLGMGDSSSTRACAAQLASALAFCHAHGVAHRDVKPENILQCGSASAPCWKLADFGAASVSRKDCAPTAAAHEWDLPAGKRMQSSRGIGSALYAAPEVVLLMDAAKSGAEPLPSPYEVYGVDVWSFGVTVYVLASGRVPFRRASGSDAAFLGFCAATQPEVLSPRAAQVAPTWAWPAHFSSGLVELLTGCLKVDPAQRISMRAASSARWLRAPSLSLPLPSLAARTPGYTPSSERSRANSGSDSTLGFAAASAEGSSGHSLACEREVHLGQLTGSILSKFPAQHFEPGDDVRLPSIATEACASAMAMDDCSSSSASDTGHCDGHTDRTSALSRTTPLETVQEGSIVLPMIEGVRR